MKNVCRILMLAVLIISSVGCQQSEGPKVENTTGKEQRWFEDFFKRHIIFVSYQDGKVHFVSDGAFGARSEGFSLDEDFYVTEGDVFYKVADHHAAAEFTVGAIDAARVILKYKSTFDHRSFGPNLITNDTGEVELEYKKY